MTAMESLPDHPHPAERGRKKESAWHNTRAQLLALALLAPVPANAGETYESHIRIERVSEDGDAFFARLNTEARGNALEQAWTHVVSPAGEEYSYASAVPGSETPNSVRVDSQEARRLVLEGNRITSCHTHPARDFSYIEGESVPIEMPSTADIEGFIYRAAAIADLRSDEPIAASDLNAIESLFEECAVNANGGYWTLRIGDSARFLEILDHIRAAEVAKQTELGTYIREQANNPELQALFPYLPKDDGMLVYMALGYAQDVTRQPGRHSYVAQRFARQVLNFEPFNGYKSPLNRLSEAMWNLADTDRPYQEGQEDAGRVVEFLQEEMGISLTWRELPRTQ